MEAVLDHVADGLLVVDDDWQITTANAVARSLLGTEREALDGADVRAVFPRSIESTFHGRFAGDDALPADLSFEEYFPELERWLDVRTVATEDGMAVVFTDVSDRKGLERQRDERDAELARLTRIDGLVQEIVDDLVGATTREQIERTVCERLAATDLYEFTWIGEREMGSDRLSHRVGAGEYDEVLEFLEAGVEDDETCLPEHEALRTDEIHVVRQLVEDEAVPERVRRAAFARGLQSSIAVPLRYGNTTYGVLGVYATRTDAFSERERQSFETLGVVTGFAINAARQRSLLLSDTVVELTFRVSDSETLFADTSATLECTLGVEGIVPRNAESLLFYLRVEGADPERFLTLTTERPEVTGGRLIHDVSDDEGDTEGGLVEVTVAHGSPLLVLVERGATIRRAEFTEGVGRIVAEVAPSEDVREIVEAVGEAFPGAELLSKRELERPVETALEFQSALSRDLTDRQRTVLRTAYHAGYFQSPRDSTAEQVAGALDISSPTLAHHLRAGLSKLLDAFFDEDAGTDRRRTADTRQSGTDR
ncbi:hypothetical protein SAMN04487948_11246 [Halogranum amylolyticum]|uniref:PAS domain-containing protein n=1 Tax=Halogranum amylolyticum TaxID=660520 RepID=A0A1H8UQU3_9EURY|nr:bacterio-opsin activator domain-containing protein [Halogranum amylolyticum]SEP05569.1 hypothetical protein SAMN04487948_11246 [Halogranum amylolyticum]